MFEPSQHTRDLLIRAFKQKRLFGLHIDLQQEYLESGLKGISSAFENVAKLSPELERQGIENRWCAIPNNTRDANKIFATNSTILHGNKEFGLVQPSLGDTVYTKSRASLLENTYFIEDFENTLGATFIVDGVMAGECVAQTLLDMGVEFPSARFIVNMTGINFEVNTAEEYSAYLDRIKSEVVDPKIAARYYAAHTDFIIETLAAT